MHYSGAVIDAFLALEYHRSAMLAESMCGPELFVICGLRDTLRRWRREGHSGRSCPLRSNPVAEEDVR